MTFAAVVMTLSGMQDTFGGIAAYEGGDQAKQDLAESVIRQMYAPVIDVTGSPLD